MAKTSKTEIQAWLGEKMASQGRSSFIAGILLMGLGLFVTFIQFWIMYALIWVISMSFGDFGHWTLVFLSLVGTGLLFLGNKLSASTNNFEPRLAPNRIINTEKMREAGYGALDEFSSFESAPPLVKFVTMPLFMGPRIVMAALGMLKQGKALQNFDHQACGRVLNSLIRAGKRIGFEKIGEKFSSLDLETIIPQLMLLDGIVLLQSEPAGLTVAPSLMDEFNEWLEKQDAGRD